MFVAIWKIVWKKCSEVRSRRGVYDKLRLLPERKKTEIFKQRFMADG